MQAQKSQSRREKLKDVYKKQAEVLVLSREVLIHGSDLKIDTLLQVTRTTQKLAEIIGCTVYDLKAEHLASEALALEEHLGSTGLYKPSEGAKNVS